MVAVVAGLPRLNSANQILQNPSSVWRIDRVAFYDRIEMEVAVGNMVALITNLDARHVISKLSKAMPLWVCFSPTNEALAGTARSENPCRSVTVFLRLPSETNEAMLGRVLMEIDQHHSPADKESVLVCMIDDPELLSGAIQACRDFDLNVRVVQIGG